jgi:hypothetical protein
MTTSYRLLLCAAAALAAAGAALAEPTAPPSTGRVLLLSNERTVEGDIERVGTQYRIRQGAGETWVPGDKVLRLCTDMKDAYRVMRGRTNLGDSDDCLRLAHWCRSRGLLTEALENVETAVRVNPSHAEARRLLNGLQRLAAAPPPSAAPQKVVAKPVEMPELNADSRAAFATKVEPILMNACAGCHSTNRGGAFKLTQNYDRTSIDNLSMQQNLAAVLAEVNLQQPQESKLLIKAITAHDPRAKAQQAPLNSRQMAAYHSIEEWVQTTLASNPHLRERTAPSPMVASAVPAPQPKPEPVPRPAAADFAVSRPAPVPTGPVDEFDPIEFNRQNQANENR